MRPLLFAALLFAASTSPALGADELLRVSAGGSLSILGSDVGAGGALAVSTPVRRNLYVGLESGFHRWNDGARRAIPILATATYHFVGASVRTFVGAAVGTALFTDAGRNAATFHLEARPGFGVELGGTFLFLETRFGLLHGQLLFAPLLGVSFLFL